MEDFRNIIEQLEEAKLFIKRGSVSTCRIALILTDNTVELILHSVSEHKLSMYEVNKRLNAQMQEIERKAKVKGKLSSLPELSASEVRSIRRSFPEKVKFLAREKFLDSTISDCLVELHETRNAAFHRGETNSTTMYILAMIYFRVACTVFKSHSPDFFHSEEAKMEFFYQRYGVEKYWDRDPKRSERIADSLLGDMHLFANQVATTFERSIKDYLKRIEQSLKFLTTNSRMTERVEHYRLATYVANEDSYPVDPNDRLSTIELRISDEIVADWLAKTESWKGLGSIEKIYLQYSKVERSAVPLVEAVERIESDLEQAIQIEIDIAKGK